MSYSRRDQEFVDRFVVILEDAGKSVWIDRQKIKAGRLWRTQIVEAIDTCDGFVLMLSTNSAASDNVRREIDLALNAGRSIFILLLEKVKLPASIRYQIIGLQHIDIQRLGAHRAVKELIETLEDELEKTQEQPVRQAELIVQRIEKGGFDLKMKEKLISSLSKLTGTPAAQLQIANPKAGSNHVFVDMPALTAFDLKALALNRDRRLRKLGIKSLKLVGDRKYINTSFGILTTAARLGLLNLLWLSIPAFFPALFGATVGKALLWSLLLLPRPSWAGLLPVLFFPHLNQR